MFNCGATNCVRQFKGKKESYMFEIERTCRYAKQGTCGYRQHKFKPKPVQINIPNNSTKIENQSQNA